MKFVAMWVLATFAVGIVGLLAVHGYVMSDGRWWVAVGQPVLIIFLVWLLVWASLQVSP